MHYLNGCEAAAVQVTYMTDSAPECATYCTAEPIITASERFYGDGNNVIGDGLPTESTPTGEFTMQEQGVPPVYQVSCTASDCLRNKGYVCRAAWLEIGYPKQGVGVDKTCKTYISNRLDLQATPTVTSQRLT